MEPEVSPNGTPVADGSASTPAEQPSLLSSQEQEQLAKLPDFLVNTVSLDDMHRAAGMESPQPVAEQPAPVADPTVTAAPVGGAPDASEAAQGGPDPVQLFFENQNKFNEGLVKQLADLTTALRPPPATPPAPEPKKLEDMSEEEAFVHLMEQRFEAKLSEALKPFEAERAAAKAAAESAAKEAEFRGRVTSVVSAAEAALPGLLGAEQLAGLSPEQKVACVDEILSAQAANAERRDAQGRMVGMSAAEAAQVVKTRWATMARLFGAPAPAQRPGVPRAQVGQSRLGPGGVSPTPFLTDAQGAQVAIPDAKSIHQKYGGSTDKILDAVADGFRRARPAQ